MTTYEIRDDEDDPLIDIVDADNEHDALMSRYYDKGLDRHREQLAIQIREEGTEEWRTFKCQLCFVSVEVRK